MLRPLSPSQKASLEEATARYQSHVGLAEEYLAGRGIDLALARDFRIGVADGLTTGQERMRGRLTIPYLGKGDTVTDIRFRALDGADPKMLGLPGVSLRLYNIRALHEAGDTVHICEGEIDAMTLAACGLHAVALPGAKTIKPHHARMFAGYTRVYVWPDGDEAGQKFGDKLAGQIDTAVLVPVPDGEDVNSIFTAEGREAILSMATC